MGAPIIIGDFKASNAVNLAEPDWGLLRSPAGVNSLATNSASSGKVRGSRHKFCVERKGAGLSPQILRRAEGCGPLATNSASSENVRLLATGPGNGIIFFATARSAAKP